MIRLLSMLVVLLAFGVALPGCEEEGSSTAAELGAKEGRRPSTAEKRPPPGPDAGGGFEKGEDDQLPPGSAPPGDDDS